MKGTVFICFVFGAFIALLVAACTELTPFRPRPTLELEPLPEFATPTVGPVTYGGVLTVRALHDVGTINPWSDDPEARKVAPLVFSGLMRPDHQLRPVPDLAETWTVSPDELTWTFKLRPNARWHDGTTFTGNDVLFSYRALIDGPAVSSAAIAVAQADLQQSVDQIEIPDPYTVRLTLRRRFAPLLSDLILPVLPAHLLRDQPVEQLTRLPITIGTGPFRLLDRKPGAPVVAEAFPQYHLGRAYMDRVAFVTAGDEQAAAKGLRDGQLLLADVSADTAASLSKEPNLAVLDYPDLGFYYVGFNLRPGHIFAGKAMRQAWRLAIDKETLIEQTIGAAAQTVYGDIPSYSWAADVQQATQRDLAKANTILEGEGWQRQADGVRNKNGQRLSIELAVRQDAPSRVALARAMADQLRDAGIEVRVVPSDYDSTMAAARRPPFDFAALLMGWTVGTDPDNYYLFHSSQIPSADHPGGYNYVGFRNDGYDRLSVEARTTSDWRRRAELYRQIEHLLSDELPYYYLWADRITVVANRRLDGIGAPFGPAFPWTVPRWSLRRS